MRIKIFVVVIGLALPGLATQALAECGQISPSPNPVGNTITNSNADACNELDRYDNFGTLNNTGTLENGGTLHNFGPLNNIGTLTNFGELVNFLSRSGSVENSGTVNNYGDIGGQGSTNNAGILNNYGTLNAGAFAENSGVVNNYSGATLSSTQRYTNDGVVNNYPGATLSIVVSGKNNGTFNNDGALIHVGRFLINSGILNNNAGATLTTINGLDNIGLLKNDGTLANDGNIRTSGNFRVSESGSVVGSGNYAQSAGSTIVDGTLTQSAIHISGGILSGIGTIISTVTLSGGTLAKSTSESTMTIDGDYTQTAESSFATVVGGPLKGNKFGSFRISGKAILAGRLHIKLYDLGGRIFAPREGDTFDILSAEYLSGTFSTIFFVPLGEDLKWEVSYLTDAHNKTDVVRLTATSVAKRTQ